MTKGIREFTNARFAKALPQLGELGNTAFRKKVMDAVITKFGISVASAATHYNHALKMQRIADPKSVDGLGRPEDKKGGRPVLNPVTVINARTSNVVAEGISKGKAETIIAQAGVLKNGANKLKLLETDEAAAA